MAAKVIPGFLCGLKQLIVFKSSIVVSYIIILVLFKPKFDEDNLTALILLLKIRA